MDFAGGFREHDPKTFCYDAPCGLLPPLPKSFHVHHEDQGTDMRLLLPSTILFLSIAALLLFPGCSSNHSDCDLNSDCPAGEACSETGTCVMAYTLLITTEALPDGLTGLSYEETIMEASGGLGTYVWTLSAGPEWLFLSETGEFSSADVSTVVGEYPVTVGVRDESNRGHGQFVERDYTLIIVGCTLAQPCYVPDGSACMLGMRPCVDGTYGECQSNNPTEYSNLFDTCGSDCSSCDDQIADRCEAGICGCGAGVAVCGEGKNCCTRGSEVACQDLMTEPTYCNDCDFNCASVVKHVENTECINGVCDYDQCADGYHDCNGDRRDGCETIQSDMQCGDCEENCTLGENLDSGTCNAETDACEYICLTGFEDCDLGDAGEIQGCETDITEPSDCGACDNNCAGSTNDMACIHDTGDVYYCGCDMGQNSGDADNPDANPACLGDNICCQNTEGNQKCVAHDAENCHGCGAVCNPFEGGIYCEANAEQAPWDCTCYEGGENLDSESCKNYDFALALCNSVTELCVCGDLNHGCLAPDACCFTASGLDCTDLNSDSFNCGMCGVGCASGVCGVVEGVGANGACHCSIDDACPSPSGAPDCIGDYCGCYSFNGEACPIGQYCVTNRGCCPSSDSPFDNCSIACINAGNEWCDDATCAASGECP